MRSILILTFALLTLGFGDRAIAYDYEAATNACDDGHTAWACYSLGMRYRDVDNNLPLAKKYLRKACNGEYWQGCNILAYLEYADGNEYAAEAVLLESCHIGDNVLGCHLLGRLESSRGNRDAARKAYKKACKGGHDLSCNIHA